VSLQQVGKPIQGADAQNDPDSRVMYGALKKKFLKELQ
jgi:hypothetical protein